MSLLRSKRDRQYRHVVKAALVKKRSELQNGDAYVVSDSGVTLSSGLASQPRSVLATPWSLMISVDELIVTAESYMSPSNADLDSWHYVLHEEALASMQHGTSTAKPPQEESSDFVLHESDFSFKRVVPHFVQQLGPILRALRTKKSRRRSHVYDPAAGNFDGDCMYAAAAYILLGQAPTRAQMNRVRLLVRDWYSSHPRELKLAADAEDLFMRSYITSFVLKGWGGAAEILALANATNICFDVYGANGDRLLRTPGCSTGYALLYNAQHYVVIKVGEQASLVPPRGHIIRKLRGGMPPLRLCDNRGARAYEKRYKTKKVDQDMPRPDSRPPLPRKKRPRATTLGDEHESAPTALSMPVNDIHAASSTEDQVPDFDTAMKHARPKSKPQPVAATAPAAHAGQVPRRDTGPPVFKKSFMAENFEDYSGSVPTKSRSEQQRQEAMALADSKRLDGLTQLGAALLRRDRGEADPDVVRSPDDTVRPEQSGHSAPQGDATEGIRVPVESLKSIPWIDQQVEPLLSALPSLGGLLASTQQAAL